MRGSDFLDKMEHIAPEYIEEAEEKTKRGKNYGLEQTRRSAYTR